MPDGGADLYASLAADRGAGEFLLRQESGAPWPPSTYNRSWKAVLKVANVQDITLHELRHTYASTIVRNGAPPIIVIQAPGTLIMAEKHYAHWRSHTPMLRLCGSENPRHNRGRVDKAA
ncbi:tyrosine-type recombinase/integrase [Mesorhizobium sp. M0460]|uniref:tyrosine-type recombinase/integrase n=1 Tax=unclassified Mesorhizobium TaxID=325217 RepID=UPI0033389946